MDGELFVLEDNLVSRVKLASVVYKVARVLNLCQVLLRPLLERFFGKLNVLVDQELDVVFLVGIESHEQASLIK